MDKKSNYNNNDDRSFPFKRGRLRDVVQPKRLRYTRPSYKSNKDAIDSLVIDLVRALADVGIVIQNVYSIAKILTRLGWVKSKKIEG